MESRETTETQLQLQLFLDRSEDQPISYTEKVSIEKLLDASQGALDKDLVADIHRRLRFSYCPPFSSPSFLSVDNPVGTTDKSDAHNAVPEAEAERSDGADHGGHALRQASLPDAFAEVPTGQLMRCVVHRSRSSMRTTAFRLYWVEGPEANSLHKEDNFMLGSRKVAVGLSFQYLVWNTAEMKEWKEKTACARITKSNSMVSARVIDNVGIPEERGGRMMVAARSAPERLVHVSAALVLSGEAVDDAVLSELLENIPSNANGTPGSAEKEDGAVPIMLMKSKMPRKVHAQGLAGMDSGAPVAAASTPVGAGMGMGPAQLFGSGYMDKDVYAMDFIGGGDNRAREASRKNIIVEEVGCISLPRLLDAADSSNSSGVVTTTSNGYFDRVPMDKGAKSHNGATMQLGKMSDEIFSLDFTQMSPYQAFVIALSVFEV